MPKNSINNSIFINTFKHLLLLFIVLQNKNGFSQKLPVSEITFDFIIQAALKHSNELEVIKSDLIDSNSAYELALDPLSPKLSSDISTTQSKMMSPYTGRPSPESSSNNGLSLSYGKMFSSGTMFQTNFTFNSNNFNYDNNTLSSGFSPPTNYSDSTFKISVQQSLLKNSFGRSTKAALKSAEQQKKIVVEKVKENAEQWLENIINLYYKTWLVQAQWENTLHRLKIQKRLLDVTHAKSSLGIAESTEVLQVESAVIQAEQALLHANKNLKKIWTSLIISLQLDKSWIEIDVTRLPILLDDPTKKASLVCNEFKQTGYKKDNAKIRELEANLESIDLNLFQVNDSEKADVYLKLQASSNGINESTSEAIKDSFTAQNPRLSLVIGINKKLDSYKESANRNSLYKAKLKAESFIKIERQNLEIQRRNNCDDFYNLTNRKKALSIVKTKQQKRSEEEESRFSLGQSDLIQAIQALNDLSSVSMELKNIEADLHVISWQIRRSNNEFDQILEKNLNS